MPKFKHLTPAMVDALVASLTPWFQGEAQRALVKLSDENANNAYSILWPLLSNTNSRVSVLETNVTTTQADIATLFATKVNRAGDTMTGKLRIISGDCTLYLGTHDRPSAYGFNGSSYFIVDKSTTPNDASVVFRDQGAARAEIGIISDNDLHFKTATGNYLSEVFIDRLILKPSGYVDVFNSKLRVNSATGTPQLVIGNSTGTAGAALEAEYQHANTQSVLRSVEWGNTYRPLSIESNGVRFIQGGASLAEVAGLSNTGVFNATGYNLNGVSIFTNTALTGVPTAPTAAAGTNTTQLATTAFTTAAIQASGAWSHVVLTADQAVSGNVEANITGFAFTPVANKSYEVRVVGSFTAQAAVTGGAFMPGVAWPTGLVTGSLVSSVVCDASVALRSASMGTTFSTGTATPTTTGVPYPISIVGTLSAGATPSGALQFRMRTDSTSGAITLKAGTILSWRAIN